jgi:hypothetical protein
MRIADYRGCLVAHCCAVATRADCGARAVVSDANPHAIAITYRLRPGTTTTPPAGHTRLRGANG